VVAALVKYARCPIVLDPVMVATSGDLLLLQEAISYLREYMLPIATLCTPNLHEARVLTGRPLLTQEEALAEIEILANVSDTSILLKGGHPIKPNSDMATDTLVFRSGEFREFSLPRLNTPNTHGTGCTLSSAIACRLAEGLTLEQAVPLAKNYLHRALLAGTYLQIGKGKGPVWHGV
jgi:hydroxymethylpyrimidine/phosphomethylpyrimidine kinase